MLENITLHVAFIPRKNATTIMLLLIFIGQKFSRFICELIEPKENVTAQKAHRPWMLVGCLLYFFYDLVRESGMKRSIHGAPFA